MGHANRENGRLTQQVRDLSRQVAVLVKEVEASRADRPSSSSSPSLRRDDNLDTSDSGGVISGRLLTFASAAELQQKNLELLTVVRELSSNQEVAESRLVEEKTAEMRKELEAAVTQLEELRSGRQRQEAMVESIIIERDMYKNIATNAQQQQREEERKQQQLVGNRGDNTVPVATSTPAGPASAGKLAMYTHVKLRYHLVRCTGEDNKKQQTTPKSRHLSLQELEKRASTAEEELQEVKKDFDEYREEKHKNDEIVKRELSEAKEALNEAR